MRSRNLLHKFILLLACASFAALPTFSQKPGRDAPRQERLLNGLKVLLWSDPSATDVKVSIRVHSGSAFDPQGKEGVMQLLSDNIFPTAVSKTFFTEDLGGDVEVITNYDYIQINASAKADQFVTLIETLAQAVSNPVIDKETTATLRKALADRLAVLEKDPAYIAEQSAAKRLFGTFPYGRPQLGSTESLPRIDFADLIFAKERFLAADNATVAISGNFNSDLGFRAARRYFGAWSKSDKRVPATFRQPDPPDTKPMEVSTVSTEGRSTFALRGLARNDPDYAASMILENILRARAQKTPGVAVSHHARLLPGVFTVSVPGSAPFPFTLFSDRVSEAEFIKARTDAAAEFAKKSLVDRWLDSDTYRIQPAPDTPAWQNVTLADVQRVADQLAKNPIASVILNPKPAVQ